MICNIEFNLVNFSARCLSIAYNVKTYGDNFLMANIVLGLGCSHTPLLALKAKDWAHRADADKANPVLNLSDGRSVTYSQLLEEVGPRYTDVVTPAILEAKALACAASVEKLADALEEAAPDLVIIVGDDQAELFSAAIQPSIAVFYGKQLVTGDKRYGDSDAPEWMQDIGRNYLMDANHLVPGAPDFALELITGLIDREIDVTSLALVENPKEAGFGHAFGFIVKRLFRGRDIPVVPVLLNTYYPPNVPSARRCHDIGKALNAIIRASASNLRVAIVASGGLSHFVVDEELDRGVIAAFERGDENYLRNIPRGALNSGSSEILNWVLTAGALGDMPVTWHDYQALYRTPAGSGVGAGFVIWKNA